MLWLPTMSLVFLNKYTILKLFDFNPKSVLYYFTILDSFFSLEHFQSIHNTLTVFKVQDIVKIKKENYFYSCFKGDWTTANIQKRLFLLHLMSKVIKRSKKETKKIKERQTGFSDFLKLYFPGSNQTSNILFPPFTPRLVFFFFS